MPVKEIPKNGHHYRDRTTPEKPIKKKVESKPLVKEILAQKVHQEPKKSTYQKDLFLFIVFIAAMVVQMEHTIALAKNASKLSSEILQYLSAGLFAFSFQFTGLLMTIRSGKRWYLILFAIIEFFVNILYYKPWVDNDLNNWVVSLLLSAAIPFAIYCYSELFTSESKNHVTQN